MTDKALSQDIPLEGSQPFSRGRTFLKGIVYYDNRRASIECTIRDLSETGACIEFTTLVSVPDNIELHISQKQITLAAQVRQRNAHQMSILFQNTRSDEPRRLVDGDMAARIMEIKNELAAMKRLLKRLQAKVFPADSEL